MQNKSVCQSTKPNQNQKPIVAAFDFDGTISTRDSLLLFLWEAKGGLKTILKLVLQTPIYIAYFFNLKSRQEVKESLLRSFFHGIPISLLKEEGKKFAMGSLKKILKEEALNKLKSHQQLGHRCVLVSANLDVYLEEFARIYGFKDCIASKVAFNTDGRVTGHLEGLNCRGLEKVRRMEEVLGPKDGYVLYAYGDSDGDREMLALADYPFYREF